MYVLCYNIYPSHCKVLVSNWNQYSKYSHIIIYLVTVYILPQTKSACQLCSSCGNHVVIDSVSRSCHLKHDNFHVKWNKCICCAAIITINEFLCPFWYLLQLPRDFVFCITERPKIIVIRLWLSICLMNLCLPHLQRHHPTFSDSTNTEDFGAFRNTLQSLTFAVITF